MFSWLRRTSRYPNVNEYAWGARLEEGDLERPLVTASCWRTSWYKRLSRSTPLPSWPTSTPCERPGASPSRSTRKRNRVSGSSGQHEMGVARGEPVRDAPAGLFEHDTLRLERPCAGEGPMVQRQPPGELVGAVTVERYAGGYRQLIAARAPEVHLWRVQVVPVG